MSEPGRLHADDIELIARRTLQLLHDATPQPGRLLSTGEMAERVGKGRDWVRENAERLGGVKLTDGRNAPWHFDPAKVADASVPLRNNTRPRRPGPTPPTARHRTASGAPLLPIRELTKQPIKER
jgi:hypothetical protein